MKITLEIPTELDARLKAVMEKMDGRLDSLYMDVLEECIADLEDYCQAKETLRQIERGEMDVISYEDWKKQHGSAAEVED